MITDLAGAQRLAADWTARLAAPPHGEPSWLARLRREAAERILREGLPRPRLEPWRYVDLERLLGAEYGPPLERALPDDRLKRLLEDHRLSADECAIVIVDGRAVPGASCAGRPASVVFSPLAASLADADVERLLREDGASGAGPFADLNALSFHDGVLLKVPAAVAADGLFHVIVHAGADRATMASPRLVVCVGAGSSARLAVTCSGSPGAPYLCNAVFDVRLGAGARLEWTLCHDGSARHSGTYSTEAVLAEGSRLDRLAFVTGGGPVLDDVRVRLEGRGGSVSLKGLSILDRDSRAHLRSRVEHVSGGCRSRQTCKNILAGRSRAEFDSRVDVRRGADGSDSQQQGRSLLLSSEAAAHARPVLRIDADDVACSHGAAVGQLDPDELFYLRSRGLSEPDARFVLLEGFADDALEEVSHPALRDRLEALARHKLAAIAAEEGTPC